MGQIDSTLKSFVVSMPTATSNDVVSTHGLLWTPFGACNSKPCFLNLGNLKVLPHGPSKFSTSCLTLIATWSNIMDVKVFTSH
jgi:hypothetical protein